MFIGTDLPKFMMKSQLRSKTRSIGIPPGGIPIDFDLSLVYVKEFSIKVT